MTTQDVSAVVGNASMTKVFNLSATDSQWDGNSLTDSISSQPLGILMPNITIDRVQVHYNGGACAWRIQNAVTLQVSRSGWGSVEQYTCNSSSMIQPYRISPNDILVVYPLPVDATALQTNALAWLTTSKGKELYKATDIPDTTATAMTTAVNNQSLGDNAFGSTLSAMSIQLEDGARLDKVEFFDNTGGVIATYNGSVRGATDGSMNLKTNIDLTMLAIPVQKGMTFKVTTISGA